MNTPYSTSLKLTTHSQPNSFMLEYILGAGGFSMVMKGLWKGLDGVEQVIAIKMQEHKESSPSTSEASIHEIASAKKHKNILRFIDSWRYEIYSFIVLEYCPEMNLSEYLHSTSQNPNWKERLEIIDGVLAGVQVLHQQQIVHYDLKCLNIMLFRSEVGSNDKKTWITKITDFGLAMNFKIYQKLTMTMQGTLQYMAPEMYESPKEIFKCRFAPDIWSTGIILLMISGSQQYLWDNAYEEDSNYLSFITSGKDNHLDRIHWLQQHVPLLENKFETTKLILSALNLI